MLKIFVFVFTQNLFYLYAESWGNRLDSAQSLEIPSGERRKPIDLFKEEMDLFNQIIKNAKNEQFGARNESGAGWQKGTPVAAVAKMQLAWIYHSNAMWSGGKDWPWEDHVVDTDSLKMAMHLYQDLAKTGKKAKFSDGESYDVSAQVSLMYCYADLRQHEKAKSIASLLLREYRDQEVIAHIGTSSPGKPYSFGSLHALARFRLARFYLEEGQANKALKLYQTNIECCGDKSYGIIGTDASRGSAEVASSAIVAWAEKTRSHQKAISMLEESIKKSTDSLVLDAVQLKIGQLYETIGNKTKAMATYKTILDRDPNINPDMFFSISDYDPQGTAWYSYRRLKEELEAEKKK